MNLVKPLLCRGSPRSNIENVEMWNDKLPCDNYVVRYLPEYRAYKEMRRYFLEHTEYTHMILATDDIVVRPEHLKKLIKDLEKYDFPVLSGMMNVDQNDTKTVNLSYRIATKARSFRTYYWIHRKDLPDGIFQVEFSGFPLMAIKREIVERFPFDADRIFEGKAAEMGASLDLVFCWKCKEANIPIYADTRIDMKHLRASGRMRIHAKPPTMNFIPVSGVPLSFEL